MVAVDSWANRLGVRKRHSTEQIAMRMERVIRTPEVVQQKAGRENIFSIPCGYASGTRGDALERRT
jgi:hypothetical protein